MHRSTSSSPLPRHAASRVIVGLALAFAGLAAVGCSSREAALVDHPVALTARGPACDTARVEVWEDQLPPGRVIEVGQLRVRTLSTDVSIQKMQERAAREGYDGIYWIDCTSPTSGDCTARAFVYSRTIAERSATRSSQVASR